MRYRLRLDRLAGFLAASRLSQNHWAIRLGLSRGHWSDIVNGRHPFPSTKTRERMLEVFGVALEELFVRDDGRTDELDFRLALSHRYELLSELGQGAMGAVHLATDRALGRLVAIKVVAQEAAAGVGVPALLQEIAFVARLQHPNILPLFDAGDAAGHPFYAMPYVREGSLRAMLERVGRVELRDAIGLVDGIARGLSHAHERQILHCDVKPENILVQDGHCFVMDFGIARKIRSESREWAAVRTELDFSAGTPAYVSPEQASGEREVDQRSDVYSLACVVYEMLSGRAPFGGRDTQEIVTRRFVESPPKLSDVAPNIPARTSAVLEQALSLDPALRPQSARELAEDLKRSERPIAALGHTDVPIARATTRAFQPRALPTASLSMSRFVSDLRLAARSLRTSWRFAAGVILTLGLGVGLGVPVLSLADTMFLRAPAGVRDPGRLVRVVERSVGSKGPYLADGLTGLDLNALSRATSFDRVGAWIVLDLSLGRGTDARSISVGAANAQLLPAIGVTPERGRFFAASEDVEGAAEPPCVVSYAFWKNNMGGADDALGRKLLIGDTRYTVVGVTPDGFNGLGLGKVDVWAPLHIVAPEFQGHDPLLWTTDNSTWLRVVARLKPGASVASASAEAQVLYRTAGERVRDKTLAGTYILDPLQPGRSSLANQNSRIALWLSGGGVLLLLLVAANLVNLFVARAAARSRQTAVRLALGGGWSDLLRIELAESFILATLAAMLGLLIATPAIGAARALLYPGFEWSAARFDLRVAGIAFIIAFSIGTVIALWATAQAAGVNASDLLRGAGSSRSGDARRAHVARRALLLVQAAVFAMLLAGASAFVRSLRRASHIDLGFDPSRVYATSINLPADTPREQWRALLVRAQERVAALPEVESATLAYMEPWQNNAGANLSIPNSTTEPPYTLLDIATPEFLRTFGAQMRGGRWFAASDAAGTSPVAVINETLANTLWPAAPAIGQCVHIGADSMPCRAIVGVIQDLHVSGGAADKPMPIAYVPFAQAAGFRQTLRVLVRPRGDGTLAARSVRAAIQSLDSNLPAVGVHPVSDNIRWMVTPLELGSAAFMAFGIVATVVGAVGLYSVLAFLIIEQRRANAIRLALGASPDRIGRAIVAYGLFTTLGGMLVGYALLLPLRHLLDPLLFQTQLFDPLAMAAVLTGGVVLSIVACFGPARAATRTDIIAILRDG